MEEFEGWLKANGGNYPRITFATSDLGGRGAIATEDILAGEEMCSIPVKLVLTTDIARKSEVGQLILAHLAAEGVRLPVSVGRAILCTFIVQQRADEGAFWGPYLRSLPPTFTTPLYWPEEDLQHLAGTNLFYALQEKKQPLKEAFDILFPSLCHKHPAVFSPALFTWDNFLWAFTACSSRSFPQTLVQQSTTSSSAPDPDDVAEVEECLLPSLDMLNHQYKKKITWSFDQANGRLKFVTDDKIEKGAEAFNNYGPKGNEELLMGYGFCIDGNEQDYVMILLSFSPADPLVSRKKALLQRLELNALQALKQDHIPPTLLDALRISVMTQWELYFFDHEQGAPGTEDEAAGVQRKRMRTEQDGREPLGSDVDNGKLFVNWRNELEMTQTLKGLLEDKVRKLGPANQLDDLSTVNGNVRNAIIYKNGQRHVLNSCIAVMERMVSETARRAAAAIVQIPATAAESTAAVYSPLPGIDHALRFTDNGVFAARDVPAGTALASIPHELLITLNTALASPLGEALQYVEGELDEDTVLMLFLVWEKGRGKKSPWHPFLRDIRPEKEAPAPKKKKKKAAKKKSAVGPKKSASQKKKEKGKGDEDPMEEETTTAKGVGGGDDEEDDEGEEGKWAGEVDLPLGWTDDERSLLGPDFETVSQLGETEEGLKEIYEQMFPALSQALPRYFPRALFTWANFRWAAMVVDSHSVRVTVPRRTNANEGVDKIAEAMLVEGEGGKEEEEEEGEEDEEEEEDEAEEEEEEQQVMAPGSTITVVLPLAVLPQHHPFACTVAGLESEGGPLVLRSLAPVAKDDRIFMAVGRGPNNAELMLRRGRITTRGGGGGADDALLLSTANPFDSVRFPFPAQIPLTLEKLALLRRNGLEDDIRARSHLLRGHGPLPSKLIDTLRVIFLPDAAVDQLLATFADNNGGDEAGDEPPIPLPTDVDVNVARLIEGTLRGLMNGLAETEAGEEDVDSGAGQRRHSRRIRRALEYRRGQQALVAHNQAQLGRWSPM